MEFEFVITDTIDDVFFCFRGFKFRRDLTLTCQHAHASRIVFYKVIFNSESEELTELSVVSNLCW